MWRIFPRTGHGVGPGGSGGVFGRELLVVDLKYLRRSRSRRGKKRIGKTMEVSAMIPIHKSLVFAVVFIEVK